MTLFCCSYIDLYTSPKSTQCTNVSFLHLNWHTLWLHPCFLVAVKRQETQGDKLLAFHSMPHEKLIVLSVITSLD